MKAITNLQQARAIVKAVGEAHQFEVSDMLRGLTYRRRETKYEQDAQEVINNMEKEYVLNVANELWHEKHDQLPEYIKNYSNDRVGSCGPLPTKEDKA